MYAQYLLTEHIAKLPRVVHSFTCIDLLWLLLRRPQKSFGLKVTT